MSSTSLITTTIEGVQADNSGDAQAAIGGKWRKILPGTANGISNIVAILCFAVG
jgi:hypothetical protein